MLQSLTDYVSGSPWTYVYLFFVSALDAVIPIVPSETSVITAGVLSALVGFTSSSAVVLAGLRGVGPDVPRRRSGLLGAGRGPARPRRADRAPRQKLTECFPMRVFITGEAGRFGYLASSPVRKQGT